jgi:hypothetical protein
MRRHLLGAPITKALRGVAAGTGNALPFMCLETRSAEALFVKPGNDRCTVVFALNFPDETDNAIARVMLQQFAKESSKVRCASACARRVGGGCPPRLRLPAARSRRSSSNLPCARPRRTTATLFEAFFLSSCFLYIQFLSFFIKFAAPCGGG